MLKELCLFDPILWCRENDVYLTGAEGPRKVGGWLPFPRRPPRPEPPREDSRHDSS